MGHGLGPRMVRAPLRAPLYHRIRVRFRPQRRLITSVVVGHDRPDAVSSDIVPAAEVVTGAVVLADEETLVEVKRSMPVHSHRLEFTGLQASGGLLRDSPLGGMFHLGKVSLRERVAKRSLHVSLGEGKRVSVHVDRYSPLADGGRGPSSRYSLVHVVGHNVGIVVDALVLVVRRRWGDQRCELECEQVCSDDHPDHPGQPPADATVERASHEDGPARG